MNAPPNPVASDGAPASGTAQLPLTIESQVRAARARVYGECTDANWEACREGWLHPANITWLERQPENAAFPIRVNPCPSVVETIKTP